MFAIGLVISAVVALPVLMATDRLRGRRAIRLAPRPARAVSCLGFYGLLRASIGLAVAVTLANISVIGMLVAASVIGGFGAHPSAW